MHVIADIIHESILNSIESMSKFIGLPCPDRQDLLGNDSRRHKGDNGSVYKKDGSRLPHTGVTNIANQKALSGSAKGEKAGRGHT